MVDDNQSSSAATVAERPGGTACNAPNAAASAAPNAAASAPTDGSALVPETLIGKVIDGRYKILKPLAEGGMGSVFLAEQIGLQRKVALKILICEEPELVQRFQREATALAEVSHPAIVEIYDFTAHAVEAGNRGCLCMAFIDGMDLSDYLDEQSERRLPPDEVISLIIPIISALVELHANGIIHRDIKPANLVRFLRADGRPGVKLVDFGIARRQVDPGMTATGLVLGTPPYLPPEAFLGENATPLMDIYALGATIFELLTGAPPFAADGQAKIIQRTLHEEPDFPDHLASTPLAALLGRMLNKIARNRPDAMQVLEGLEQVRAEQRPAPGQPTRDSRPASKATRPLQATAARLRANYEPETQTIDAVQGGIHKGALASLIILVMIQASVILYLFFGR